MNAKARVPGQPVGIGGGNFSKNAEHQQQNNSLEQHMIWTIWEKAVEGVFENQWFGGIDRRKHQCDEENQVNRASVRKCESQGAQQLSMTIGIPRARIEVFTCPKKCRFSAGGY